MTQLPPIPTTLVCYVVYTQSVSMIHHLSAFFSSSILNHSATPTTTTTTTLLTITLLLTLALALYSIRKDYLAWLALGPGGLPPTPKGYLHICLLRPFALRNPLAPPRLSPTLHPRDGFLASSSSTTTLPNRPGPRPTVQGIAPHRQTTQAGDATTYKSLKTHLSSIADTHAHSHGLYVDTSCFEKHSVGIFCAPGFCFRATCKGEVCHAHPSDGSLHLTLHPADVRVVLEKGWGQRHPMAREEEGCWWWALVKRWYSAVPSGFVMSYAPRDEEEVAVVLEIVRAAVGWVSGKDLKDC